MLNSAIDPTFQAENGSSENNKVSRKKHKSKRSEEETNEDSEKAAKEENQNLRNVGLDPEVTVAAIAAAAAANAHMNEEIDAKNEESDSKNDSASRLHLDAQIDRKSNIKAEDSYKDKLGIGTNSEELTLSSRISPVLLAKDNLDRDKGGAVSHRNRKSGLNFTGSGENTAFNGNNGKLPTNQVRLHTGNTKSTAYVKPVKNSKRAAQNRTAQRAFRERRKRKIKDLEIIAVQHEKCDKTIARLRQENNQLKDYIQALESKLADIRSAASPSLSTTSSKDFGSKDAINGESPSEKQDPSQETETTQNEH